MSKIRIGIVNYLNTKPLLYGIEHSPVSNIIELVPDYPSNIAAMLLENRIDLGLVPVVVIPRIQEAQIITEYCIGCNGPVVSVGLLSQVPIYEIKKVLLDYQSQTSAGLIKILFEKYWKIEVEWINTQSDFRNQISGTTAGLLIGDRCMEYRNIVPYMYDLGEAWKNLTGLPFVFAAWISNKKLPDEFIQAFNKANQWGVASIGKVAAENNIPGYDSLFYFTNNISYQLDDEKRKGMELFLKYLGESEQTLVDKEQR